MEEIVEVIEAESLLVAEASFLELAYDPEPDLKSKKKNQKRGKKEVNSELEPTKKEGLPGLDGKLGNHGKKGTKGNNGYLGNIGKVGKEGTRLDTLNFNLFSNQDNKKWTLPKISEKVEIESVLSFIFISLTLALIYFTLKQRDD